MTSWTGLLADGTRVTHPVEEDLRALGRDVVGADDVPKVGGCFRRVTGWGHMVAKDPPRLIAAAAREE